MTEPGYDDGGILSAPSAIPASTLRPVRHFDAEQLAAFERVVELVGRWAERDEQST